MGYLTHGLIIDAMPNFTKKVSSVFDQIWLSPDKMKYEIGRLFDKNVGVPYREIIVSGETTNLTMYAILEDESILV